MDTDGAFTFPGETTGRTLVLFDDGASEAGMAAVQLLSLPISACSSDSRSAFSFVVSLSALPQLTWKGTDTEKKKNDTLAEESRRAMLAVWRLSRPVSDAQRRRSPRDRRVVSKLRIRN